MSIPAKIDNEVSFLGPVPTRPVVPGVTIARLVLLVHVVPEVLHGVAVQDVGEHQLVSELVSMREVFAVVPALRLVHHDGVGPEASPVPALGSPGGGGRGGGDVIHRGGEQALPGLGGEARHQGDQVRGCGGASHCHRCVRFVMRSNRLPGLLYSHFCYLSLNSLN